MATNRVFNFAAGPACLPLEVLEQAQADLVSFAGSGMSVMEMSHRSKEFEGIIKAAEADLRKLLDIPDNYKVLFVQGGASTQFAAIAYNFAAAGDAADYVITGAWSKKAYEEGVKLGLKANVAAKGDNKSIPPRDSWKLTPGAKFVHYCDNETIGVRLLGRLWGGFGTALGGLWRALEGCSTGSARPGRALLRLARSPLAAAAVPGGAAGGGATARRGARPSRPSSPPNPPPPQGVEFPAAPDVGDVPLIADMSSDFLSKPVDVSKSARRGFRV